MWGRDVVGGMWGRAVWMCVPGQEPVNVFEELTLGARGIAHNAHVEVPSQRDTLIGHSSDKGTERKEGDGGERGSRDEGVLGGLKVGLQQEGKK